MRARFVRAAAGCLGKSAAAAADVCFGSRHRSMKFHLIALKGWAYKWRFLRIAAIGVCPGRRVRARFVHVWHCLRYASLKTWMLPVGATLTCQQLMGGN